MILFQTSTLEAHTYEGETKVPAPIQNPNGLLDLMRRRLPEKLRVLSIASDPEAHEINDFYLALNREGLGLSGLQITEMALLDGRNPEALGPLLAQSDLVLLSGGHVPTQWAFFQSIGLKAALRDYEGVAVGISAGSMNASALVYAQPELEGEARDPGFQRWLPGLGLSPVTLVPHWQDIRELSLDGLGILEEISLPDSRVHPFYAIPDGSFFLTEGGHTALYGEGWLLAEGKIHQISRVGEILRIS